MEDSSEKPARRRRYLGRNPRHFSDKYKELNPEQFPDQIGKAIERGQTPAGMHRPIMVTEILEILRLSRGDVVLDCTVGFGGHSEAIMNAILPGGRLLGIDADPIELPKTELRLRALCASNEELVLRRMNYAGAAQFVADQTTSGVDGLLADLGISSMQFDNPERGFASKVNGPLDMRMNPRRGKSASNWLSTLQEEELSQIFRWNADEPNSERLSRAILNSHSLQPLETTFELVDVIRRNCQQLSKEDTETTIRRVFQAIRIEINDEFACLDTMLGQLPSCMKPGGRIAIISFHSGEDRRVKAAFKEGLQNGVYSSVSPELIRPSMAEQRSNLRSRSAKLRWAVRS